MFGKTKVIVIALCVLLTGCASSYKPKVDLSNIEQEKYEADLAECRAYAEQLDGSYLGLFHPSIGLGVGSHGGFGVGLGLGLNLFALGNTPGAVKTRAIDECLTRKGYKILDDSSVYDEN